VKLFRIISAVEGLSFLIILSVSAGFISREYVFTLGMLHGVLFMLYMVLSLIVSHRQGWSVIVWVLVFAAALVPFAFVLVEIYLRREIAKQALLVDEVPKSLNT
jgi:integral membrane protein